MNFQEALQELGIEKYAERIWHSNSHGELFHLDQYFTLAELVKENNDKEWFCKWFEYIVKYAEQNWERPESIFQHIHKILVQQLEQSNAQ